MVYPAWLNEPFLLTQHAIIPKWLAGCGFGRAAWSNSDRCGGAPPSSDFRPSRRTLSQCYYLDQALIRWGALNQVGKNMKLSFLIQGTAE
jgi:hypothetical protein